MKFRLYYFIMSLLIVTTISLAQTPQHYSCAVSGEPHAVSFSPLNRNALSPVYSGSVDPNLLASYEPISFNIYFWIINRSNGMRENPITNESIIKTLQGVNEFFKPMGICFVFKGFNYINSDAIYNGAHHFSVTDYAVNNNRVIPNSFNVYIPKALARGVGATNYGSNLIVVNEDSTLGMWEFVDGRVLAHEIGHTFNLMHVWGNNNDGSMTDENVTRNPLDPNYNALTAADKIHDTPAMTSFWGEAIPPKTIDSVLDTKNCLYIGTRKDPQGTPFSLTPTDVGNPMAYTWAPCTKPFTVGQGIRIREYIAGTPNVPSVQAMVTTNPATSLTLNTSETNTSFIYWYSNSIRTSFNYKTIPGQSINLVAGDQIILEPNTDIKTGSIFVAEIDSYACVPSISNRKVNYNDKYITSTDEKTEIKLYPNPNNGNFEVVLDKEIKTAVNVYVYDLYGKVIYSDVKASSSFGINLPNLSAGVYIVKISSIEYNETIKFVKE